MKLRLDNLLKMWYHFENRMQQLTMNHFSQAGRNSPMSTLIAFATTHGCTEKCAQDLKGLLKGEITLYNMKDRDRLDIDEYDTVIIGGSIHAGKIQRRVKNFCKKYSERLKTKKLGLYLCCMEEGENAQKQFNGNYPEDLIRHATATGLFGGAFNFDRMNAIEKAIIKKVAKVEENVSKIIEDRIKTFAKEMQ